MSDWDIEEGEVAYGSRIAEYPREQLLVEARYWHRRTRTQELREYEQLRRDRERDSE